MKLANIISRFNRNRKWKLFLKYIQFDDKTKILDAGFCDKEYSLNDNYFEKNYPFKNNITALGVTGNEYFSKNYPEVKAVLYDGFIFPFKNKTFNICWSNAVIEHVGDFEKQLLFVKEMCRVASVIFFTTPNRLFPIEVHTRTPLLHLISWKLFQKYLKLIGKSWATGDYMNLLTKKSIILLLKNAGVKNFEIFCNRFLGFTLDFVIIINESLIN